MTNRITLTTTLLAISLCGCIGAAAGASGDIKPKMLKQASYDLDCPEAELTSELFESSPMEKHIVRGCGKEGMYTGACDNIGNCNVGLSAPIRTTGGEAPSTAPEGEAAAADAAEAATEADPAAGAAPEAAAAEAN